MKLVAEWTTFVINKYLQFQAILPQCTAARDLSVTEHKNKTIKNPNL